MQTAEERVLEELDEGDASEEGLSKAPSLTPGKKALAFYSSPFVKSVNTVLVMTAQAKYVWDRFIADCTAHLLLCLLFSVYILAAFEDYFSALEVILLLWCLARSAEEVREALPSPEVYFASTWNRLDLLVLTSYFGGLFIRINNLTDSRTKVQCCQ